MHVVPDLVDAREAFRCLLPCYCSNNRNVNYYRIAHLTWFVTLNLLSFGHGSV